MEILSRGIGRRKEAIAQIVLKRGTGVFIINNLPIENYLQNNTCALISVKSPLIVLDNLFNETYKKTDLNPRISESGLSFSKQKLTSSSEIKHQNELTFNQKIYDQVDTVVKVKGGGLIGQTEAIKLGLSRAICQLLTQTSQNQKKISTSNPQEIGKSLNLFTTNTMNEITNESLYEQNSELSVAVHKIFKDKGFLTQDSRIKERRKYGLKKARKASQYHKR